MKIVRNNFTSV